jgi:hypothetical protein
MEKLVNVELPKKDTKGELKACESCDSGEKWPWGLRLTFEKEQVDLMPYLKNFTLGEKVNVVAIASVKSIRQNESKERTSYSVELQIEEVACEAVKPKKLEDMNPEEYRNARGK